MTSLNIWPRKFRKLNNICHKSNLHTNADKKGKILKGTWNLIIESIIAFFIVFAAASAIYLLGRRSAPKPAQSENERLTYACGEKTLSRALELAFRYPNI